MIGVIKPDVVCQPQFAGLLEGVVALVIFEYSRQHVVWMDNYHLYKFHHKLATVDGLTNPYNRHYFNDVFEQLVVETRHSQHPISVLSIDVDGFKSVND